MKCEKCGGDSDTFALLPARKPDGSLNEIVCRNCALDSSAYCKKHQMPHLGFSDDETTACRICIEEAVAENRDRVEEIYSTIKDKLPLEEIDELDDWARLVSSITGNSIAVCVLRGVATKSLRLGIGIDNVVEKIIETKSVNLILPNAF
ncbi:MAG: hypothetical protein ABII97_01190 [Patescibacteria group bacterium]